MAIKIWVDDVRPAPLGYMNAYTTNIAINIIRIAVENEIDIEVIDIDHDAGEWAYDGGDYIKILDWMERNQVSIPIRIHSMNPVGVENMRRIIQKNGWTEVF
jgi:hypothetical protein